MKNGYNLNFRYTNKNEPTIKEYENVLGSFLTDPKDESLQPKNANTGRPENPVGPGGQY